MTFINCKKNPPPPLKKVLWQSWGIIKEKRIPLKPLRKNSPDMVMENLTEMLVSSVLRRNSRLIQKNDNSTK